MKINSLAGEKLVSLPLLAEKLWKELPSWFVLAPRTLCLAREDRYTARRRDSTQGSPRGRRGDKREPGERCGRAGRELEMQREGWQPREDWTESLGSRRKGKGLWWVSGTFTATWRFCGGWMKTQATTPFWNIIYAYETTCLLAVLGELESFDWLTPFSVFARLPIAEPCISPFPGGCCILTFLWELSISSSSHCLLP